MGKIDNGIVSVNAYGVYNNITFPLLFKVFKPQGTLQAGDKYKTKIELVTEIITELIELGCNVELVLADSLYGESSQFIRRLAAYNLAYVVAIRCNHGVWLPVDQKVRANKWCKFIRTFSNQKSETRCIREIIYGKRRDITYWELTTDPETMPENSTSFVMTNLKGKLKKILGDLYGLRTLARYFHLDDQALQLVKKRRGDHNRLGFAVQLGTVRFLGTFLNNPLDVPTNVVNYLASQLKITESNCLSQYLNRIRTHWEHIEEIKYHYGYP